MEELAAGDLLPGRIYLCGGGSRLPEIRAALADPAFSKRLPFARPPEVTIMSPDQIETIRDETQLLVDQQDVTPMGLAYQAIELGQATRTLDGGTAPRRPAAPDLTMAAIVYLDVDDEITSAAARSAARWRTTGSPSCCRYGSRLATSRINFRLLAREAAQAQQDARDRHRATPRRGPWPRRPASRPTPRSPRSRAAPAGRGRWEPATDAGCRSGRMDRPRRRCAVARRHPTVDSPTTARPPSTGPGAPCRAEPAASSGPVPQVGPRPPNRTRGRASRSCLVAWWCSPSAGSPASSCCRRAIDRPRPGVGYRRPDLDRA